MNAVTSLTYKLSLSSTVSYLSPVVDLSTASVKTVSNRIESASGQEDRYGRRDQIIKFFPIYKFNLGNTGGTQIQDNQSIEGYTSKAVGTIAKVDGTTVWVRLKTSQFFKRGERVALGNQPTLTETEGGVVVPAAKVDTNPIEIFISIPDSATMVARNPSTILETYDNIITGLSLIHI